MISSFFVLSPRGDTIIAKQYRDETAAHERSHTDALFRKIKFWNDQSEDGNLESETKPSDGAKGDAPPVLIMPDGNTYCHIQRNGLIFGATTARNASPNTIIEVSTLNSSLRMRVKTVANFCFLYLSF